MTEGPAGKTLAAPAVPGRSRVTLQLIADRLAEGVDLSDPLLTPEMKALAEKELGCELEPAEIKAKP